MKIILLLCIPVLLGLMALVGAVNQNPVQVSQPTRSQFDGGICLGAIIFAAFVGFIVFPDAYDGARGFASDLRQVLPITDPRADEPEISRDGSYIGYRYFTKFESDGSLHSVGKGAVVGWNPITGRHSHDYSGGWNISNRVPTLKNESGIYAAKKQDSHILAPWAHGDHVLAKVELSGRVIEGEYGYRAQYCRILEVYE